MIRPTFVFLENVSAITARGLERIISEWTALGYDCRWTILSAADIRAPHIRSRWWLLAHANGTRERIQSIKQSWSSDTSESGNNGKKESMADSNSMREPQQERGKQNKWGRPTNSGWWSTEPDVGRVANGVSARLDRIKCLGNAVVPAQAKKAFKKLMGL